MCRTRTRATGPESAAPTAALQRTPLDDSTALDERLERALADEKLSAVGAHDDLVLVLRGKKGTRRGGRGAGNRGKDKTRPAGSCTAACRFCSMAHQVDKLDGVAGGAAAGDGRVARHHLDGLLVDELHCVHRLGLEGEQGRVWAEWGRPWRRRAAEKARRTGRRGDGPAGKRVAGMTERSVEDEGAFVQARRHHRYKKATMALGRRRAEEDGWPLCARALCSARQPAVSHPATLCAYLDISNDKALLLDGLWGNRGEEGQVLPAATLA